jgi:glycosidase
MADFGYDVADYCAIHPSFGSLDDFERLVAAAHERNLKLILDYAPNHTSDQHPWFIESRSSRTSSKRDWYIWRDAKPEGCVANLERRSERPNRSVERSGGKQVKLFAERWLPIAGVVRLLFAHHVDHLDPTQDHSR